MIFGICLSLGQDAIHVHFYDQEDINESKSTLTNKSLIDDPQKQMIGIEGSFSFECSNCFDLKVFRTWTNIKISGPP